MIQDLDLNASTIVLVIVVLVLFVLAFRVAAATWSGKRGCHGKDECECGDREHRE